jgi:hypothetical protein
MYKYEGLLLERDITIDVVKSYGFPEKIEEISLFFEEKTRNMTLLEAMSEVEWPDIRIDKIETNNFNIPGIV